MQLLHPPFELVEHIGKRVFVYLNLHQTKKQGTPIWSVKSCKTGRVMGHTPIIVLQDAEFVVQQAGRARVLREGKKNVHAGVRGTISASSAFLPLPRPWFRRARYNPYREDHFVAGAGRTYRRVDRSSLVSMVDGRVYFKDCTLKE